VLGCERGSNGRPQAEGAGGIDVHAVEEGLDVPFARTVFGPRLDFDRGGDQVDERIEIRRRGAARGAIGRATGLIALARGEQVADGVEGSTLPGRLDRLLSGAGPRECEYGNQRAADHRGSCMKR
jgi:hypothetical protein